MRRREFIGRIAASFIVVQGLYHLQGCVSTDSLSKVSKNLQGKFDELVQWLKDKGWSAYLKKVAGLDLDKSGEELLTELVRKLDGLPSTEHGFEDFAGIRAIEAGMPAMSLLYHALASARVRPMDENQVPFPLESYPTIAQLDVVENYIYALQDFKLTEAELKDNYVLAVLAYEYRPAYKTPHHAHADLVFSRTGVARIGEFEYNYDRVNRNFTNAPQDESLKTRVAVTAARYGLFLAKVLPGKDADLVEDHTLTRKGEISLLGTERSTEEGNINDDERYFLQPVRKIFKDDLLIDEQPLAFKEYHKQEKLYRLVADPEFKIPYADGLDINKAPFIVESNTESSGGKQESALIVFNPQESSVVVSSKSKPLIRPAMQNGKRLQFESPEKWTDPDDVEKSNHYFTTFNSQKLVESIEILTDTVVGTDTTYKRFQNEFNNPRNTPLYLNIRYMDTAGSGNIVHVDDDRHIDSKHWTAVFEDSICDGQVVAEVAGWKSSVLPAELFSSALPAFSIVTAPDFFPQVDGFDLLAYDIDTQRHIGPESNFYEGGLPSLSAGRIKPNPHTVSFPEFTSESKKDLKYTYTSVHSNSAVKDFKATEDFSDPVQRDYKSSSFLPDVCSFVFAPGWDVTYCDDNDIAKGDGPETRREKSFLSTRGLGSPFPEDMKLCAAVNGMWPVASPDAARTFQGSHYAIDRNPTAIPLMDDEIGIHKNAPALKSENPLLTEEIFGWDGEQGPFLQIDPDNSKRFLVNFTELRRSDYLENLTNPALHSFDMSKLRELNSAELVMRMNALRRCIKCLPEITFKEGLVDHHTVAYTRWWLVSAERVEDWSKGAKGYGVPDGMFADGRAAVTTAQSGIEKDGYLYIFINTEKENLVDEDDQNSYRWEGGNNKGKRRLQTCATIYVCQVSEQTIAHCIREGNVPYPKDVQWNFCNE